MAQFEIPNHEIVGPLTEHTFTLQDSDRKIVYKECLNEKGKCIDVEDVISRLLSLQRVDIDTLDNGEFIEKHERIEVDGMYILSEDLDKLISELKRSL